MPWPRAREDIFVNPSVGPAPNQAPAPDQRRVAMAALRRRREDEALARLSDSMAYSQILGSPAASGIQPIAGSPWEGVFPERDETGALLQGWDPSRLRPGDLELIQMVARRQARRGSR